MTLGPLAARRRRPSSDVVHRWLTTPWVPPAALAAILGLDGALQARHWPLPAMGMLDEPAHAGTAGIALATFLPRRAAGLAPWALAGSMLIDLDHIPLYAWGALSSGPGRRPVTHSLPTVAALAIAGGAWPRLRTPLRGLALGVVLHFVRDIATGPGLPLLWPLTRRAVRVPYPTYPVALAVAAAATLRNRQRRGGRLPG